MTIKCKNVRNYISEKQRKNAIRSHNFTLGDIVEEDEVAEHGDEAEEAESGNNVDHRVLQVKFSCSDRIYHEPQKLPV